MLGNSEIRRGHGVGSFDSKDMTLVLLMRNQSEKPYHDAIFLLELDM